MTVLRPVQAGDSMTSVLLGEPTGLCMTRVRVVWFVCSGWGRLGVVHEDRGWSESVSSVAHSRIHSRSCDRCYGRDRSFFRIWPELSALGALANPRRELFDVIEDLTPLGHLGQNLLLRVHHRGVVAAEGLADLG